MSEEEEYYREEWMTDDQWECAKMFADIRCGFHHVGAVFKKFGAGIEVNPSYGSWATYDFSDLTRLVVFAHDRLIRTEIRPSGPGKLKFVLWKRHSRDGGMTDRHPTIEEAIEYIRTTEAKRGEHK